MVLRFNLSGAVHEDSRWKPGSVSGRITDQLRQSSSNELTDHSWDTITVDQRRRQHSALAQADDELLFGAELDFLDKLDNLAILDPPEYRFDCLDRVTVTKRFVDVEFDFDFVL